MGNTCAPNSSICAVPLWGPGQSFVVCARLLTLYAEPDEVMLTLMSIVPSKAGNAWTM